MSIELKINDKDGNGNNLPIDKVCVTVLFWIPEEMPEAVKQLIEKAESIFGVGSHIAIEGRTRNDKGFLDHGYLMAYKGKGI